MMRLSLICLIILFSCSKEVSVDQAAELISSEKLMNRIATFSSDDFQGRAPATKGGEKAISYLLDEYAKIGLKPINGSYTQDVKLKSYKKNVEKSSLVIKDGRKTIKLNTDDHNDPNITFWSSKQKESIDLKDKEILFVGYGVEASEFSWDDFKGADLKDKILLMLNNDPQIAKNGKLDPDYFKGESRTYYGRYTYKFEQAMKHGAAGVILIHTTASAGYGFSVLQHSGSSSHFAIDIENTGYQVDFLAHLDSLSSDKLARKFGKNLPELFKIANRPDFAPIATGLTLTSHIETELSEVNTKNVFGMIEGSDPNLKNQHILFSAHYDHEGVKEDATEGEDNVYNGAWDNASGSMSLLSLAESFVKLKPKRSIIFFHCAAEESGLLGSQYFVNKPPIPLNQIVADINIDMPNIYGLSRDLAVVGVNSNSLGDDLKELAKTISVSSAEKLLVTDDPNPNAGLFYRSDQVHFAKAGVPALFVQSGEDFPNKAKGFYNKKMEAVYHKASDEIDSDWDLSGLQRDLRLILKLAYKVANDNEAPTWHSGNEFESKYKQLYNK
jgi:Zn-dependent M28 family amino/carboxypeptidase